MWHHIAVLPLPFTLSMVLQLRLDQLGPLSTLMGQAVNVKIQSTCTVGYSRTVTHRHLYYKSVIRMILIYHPSKGGRLSQPSHCSNCSAHAQSCVSLAGVQLRTEKSEFNTPPHNGAHGPRRSLSNMHKEESNHYKDWQDLV